MVAWRRSNSLLDGSLLAFSSNCLERASVLSPRPCRYVDNCCKSWSSAVNFSSLVGIDLFLGCIFRWKNLQCICVTIEEVEQTNHGTQLNYLSTFKLSL